MTVSSPTFLGVLFSLSRYGEGTYFPVVQMMVLTDPSVSCSCTAENHCEALGNLPKLRWSLKSTGWSVANDGHQYSLLPARAPICLASMTRSLGPRFKSLAGTWRAIST